MADFMYGNKEKDIVSYLNFAFAALKARVCRTGLLPTRPSNTGELGSIVFGPIGYRRAAHGIWRDL